MEVDGAAAEAAAAAPPVPEKPKFVSVHLAVEAVWIRGSLSPDDQLVQREIEVSLVDADREWKARQDARNQLEEYVYEWRDRVTNKAEHASFLKNLEDTKDWMYETDDLLTKSAYLERLNQLDSECKVLFPPPPPPPPVEPEPPVASSAEETAAEQQSAAGEPADVHVEGQAA